MSYSVAWMVAGVAGLVGVVGLYFLTRSVSSRLLRYLLLLLPPVLLLVPAPVPGYAGAWAPAFVVAFFESVFVTDGRPRPALVILALAAVIAMASAVLLNRLGRRKTAAEMDAN